MGWVCSTLIGCLASTETTKTAGDVTRFYQSGDSRPATYWGYEEKYYWTREFVQYVVIFYKPLNQEEGCSLSAASCGPATVQELWAGSPRRGHALPLSWRKIFPMPIQTHWNILLHYKLFWNKRKTWLGDKSCSQNWICNQSLDTDLTKWAKHFESGGFILPSLNQHFKHM